MQTWSCSETTAFDLHLQRERAIPASLLMENAGAALACFALARVEDRACQEVLAVVGPGNNGGDALVALRQLVGRLPVRAWCPLGLPKADSGLTALRAAQGMGVPLLDGGPPPALGPSTMALDGLFGTGLTRPLEGPAAAAVALLNDGAAPVLAVDIPSGLDGDDGRVLGCAVRADWTLSFVAPKHGFLLGSGPEHCGELAVAPIGVSEAYAEAWVRARRNPD